MPYSTALSIKKKTPPQKKPKAVKVRGGSRVGVCCLYLREQACYAGCAQTLSDATPPIDKIQQFRKVL